MFTAYSKSILSKMKPVATSNFYSRRKRQLLEDKSEENDTVSVKVGLNEQNERRRKMWEQKLQRINKIVQSLKDQPLPIKRKVRISDPLSIYRLFPKQQQAFEFLKSCGQDLVVFSKELDCDGKRNFLVTTTQEFWKMYKTLPPGERCYYEVIPEGYPCRLYFDLEFKKELNAKHDGEKMVEIFIKCVCQELNKVYDISCDLRNVINMDSSTENKFSTHLIFHLPNAVFKDNTHAGRFVEHLCSEIQASLTASKREEHECEVTMNQLSDGREIENHANANIPEVLACGEECTVSELQSLIVKNSKGGEDIFCDRGVYTKNRNFRLYLSTKFGRNSPLVLAKQAIYKPNRDKKSIYSVTGDSEYWLFIDSLVSNFSLDPNCRILTFDDVPRPDHVPRKSRKNSAPVEMSKESPYPEVDNFIKDNICKGGIQGYIRRCVYFKEGNMIIYDIGNNRWCENIGRPHRSNHIMMVADLAHGVYYQKCHDPECKKIDYRSEELPLPLNINPMASNHCDDELLADLDENIDEALLAAVEELEGQSIIEKRLVR